LPKPQQEAPQSIYLLTYSQLPIKFTSQLHQSLALSTFPLQTFALMHKNLHPLYTLRVTSFNRQMVCTAVQAKTWVTTLVLTLLQISFHKFVPYGQLSQNGLCL
jgi:hypothetical protein